MNGALTSGTDAGCFLYTKGEERIDELLIPEVLGHAWTPTLGEQGGRFG